MATTPLTLSVSQPRFGRRERTEIRANFARDVLADMKAAYFADDRLNIHPVSDFIKSVVDRSGAVVVVLGACKSESDTRAQTMNANAISGQRFRPHTDLPKAWGYTPLEDLSTNEVWVYLLQVPSPWDGDNKGLVTLYRKANGGGEWRLVIVEPTDLAVES